MLFAGLAVSLKRQHTSQFAALPGPEAASFRMINATPLARPSGSRERPHVPCLQEVPVSPSNSKPLTVLAWSVGLAAMLAAMLGAATVWLSVRIQQDEQMVRHTLAVQNQVTRILSLVQHVETSQRGYLLTGRSIYLDNYKGAETTLSAVMDEASRLVAGSPQQRQTVAHLRQVVNDKLDEVRSTIDEQHAGHPDAARAIVNSDRGLKMTEQIHQLVSEIKSEEDRSLSIREAASKVVGTLLQAGAATAFVLIGPSHGAAAQEPAAL
jgi:CHASE3 domain sensor protein